MSRSQRRAMIDREEPKLSHQVNRKRVRRLMQLIGLEAIYRRPNTSKPNPGHKVYPYLRRGLEINRVNQVWATDITAGAGAWTTSSWNGCGAASSTRRCT